jgi:hypothetical protein
MFNASAIQIESEYKRQEMLRRAEQHRFIREVSKSTPHAVKSLPSLTVLLTVLRSW